MANPPSTLSMTNSVMPDLSSNSGRLHRKDRDRINAAAVQSGETLLGALRDLMSVDPLVANGGMTQRALADIVRAIEKTEIKLVFSGSFKAGKSSTLNVIIGRSVLPSGILPETGAICTIRSGGEDSATVRRSGRLIAIECSLESIRSVSSIVDRETGGSRDLSDLDQIEVTLKTACIPKDAIWVDSPGIMDDKAMDERAARAAEEADLLVWVLWTKHPLGEAEAAFLQRYLHLNGAASTVFLLNCFLEEDGEDSWNEYAIQDVPRIWRKLEEVVGAMGLSDDVPLVMLPISARAILEVDQNAFGGPELRALVGQFDSQLHPRIQRTRWYRAAARLDLLADHWEQARDREQKENLRQDNLEQTGREMVQTVNERFQEFSLTWSGMAREAGRELADSLNLSNLWKDAAQHGPELAKRIDRLGDVPYSSLRRALDRLFRQFGQATTPPEIGKMLEILRSHKLENDVAKAQMHPKAWAKFGGAAGVATLAIPVVGIATLLGGGVVALAQARNQLEEVRQSISAAVEKFSLELENKIGQIAPCVIGQFPQCAPLGADPASDHNEEQRLEILSTKLRTAAAEARRISESFVV